MRFSEKKIVLCQQQTPPLHTLPISSFLYLYPIKDCVEHQRRSFSQQQKSANHGLFYPFTIPIINNSVFEKENGLFSTEISKLKCNSGRV